MKTSKRLIENTLPSGDVRLTSGFTGEIITYLLLSEIEECDIITLGVPAISYTFAGKTRKFTPDIFIPSRNTIVEVKSAYVWSRNIPKNLAKRDAIKEAGFNCMMIIWDERKSCIRQILN